MSQGRPKALSSRKLRAAAFLCWGAVLCARAPHAQQETPAERPVVRSIEVVGNERYGDEQLVAALGVQIGEPLDRELVERGIHVLFETFKVRAELYERPAAAPAAGAEPSAPAVDLRLVVRELALDLEPRFVGNVAIDTEELLEWAGLTEDEELYLYEAPRVRERVLEGYRREGFHFAEVHVVERAGGIDPETGEERAADVIFEIEEGPQVAVAGIELHGNEFLPAGRFLWFRRGLPRLARAELRGPVLFGLFPKDFVMETLEADLVALREVYRDFGFLDAVVELERLEFSAHREDVTIHVAVDEGPRYRVGSVSIEAVERVADEDSPRGWSEQPVELALSEQELREVLEVEPGAPYERRLRDADEGELRRLFGRHGYVDHPTLPAWDRWSFLEPELVFERDRPVVHVTYRIAQGRPIFLREIRVRGNLHTQDRVVRRLVTPQPGELANAEKIEASRARIQGTGFFSDQRDIEHLEPRYRFVDTPDPNWKDLEYLVEEGQVLDFQISGGVSSSFGAFGQVSLVHRNFDLFAPPRSPWSLIGDVASRRAFHGAGQTLRLRAQPGTEVSFFDVLFHEPDVFGRHFNRISLSLSARKRRHIFDAYDEEREEYGFELGRQLSPDSAIFAGFEIGTVEVDDIDTTGEPNLGNPLAVPVDLKAQEGESDLVHASLAWRWSELDLPSPYTREGIGVRLETQVYSEALGSDFDFVKAQVLTDFWDEFDDDPELVSPRYHLELWSGVAIPYGESDEVPYTERFFLGGQRRGRGFRFRGVGPNENGEPIGGQTVLFGSAEYLHPLVKQVQPGTYREIETLYGGFFVDVGVLDPEDFELDPDEVRVSAGVLFGLSVPLPITFSFGWPIREGEGDETRVLGFSIGSP